MICTMKMIRLGIPIANDRKIYACKPGMWIFVILNDFNNIATIRNNVDKIIINPQSYTHDKS